MITQNFNISPNSILSILSSNGQFVTYLILFVIMFFEGPIAICISAFAASLGYLDIFIIIIIGVLGGIIPDTILFFIGVMLNKTGEEKLIRYFGLKKSKIEWIKENVKKHPVKIIAFVKHVPPFPVPGLILCGYMKMDFKKFFVVMSIFNIFGTLVFALLGYYFGLFALGLTSYFKFAPIIIFLLILMIVLIYYIIILTRKKLLKLAIKK